jgi:hypothetical protein
LKKLGLDVVFNAKADWNDLKVAFTDAEARFILAAAHGKRSGTMETRDEKKFTPEDATMLVGLKKVVFESCKLGTESAKGAWSEALGSHVDIVGWEDEIGVPFDEMIKYNSNGGYFDGRNTYSLQKDLNEVFGKEKE